MSEPVSGWLLYRHRQDHSIILLARPLANDTYECKRYGTEVVFVLPAETFNELYERKS